MITYLIQSTVILTLFLLVYKLVLQRFTFFQANRLFLLAGLVFSMSVPLLPLNFSEEKTEYVYLSRHNFENIITENPENIQSLNGLEPVPEISENSLNEAQAGGLRQQFWSNWEWEEYVLAVYFSGFLFFVLLFFFQLMQVFLVIRSGKTEKQNGMNMVLTDKELSPFSFFNIIVFNPSLLSGNQVKDILTHENIHINQWHQLDVVLAEITKIILWFLPVSWWYENTIKVNLEFIADRVSLENGLDKKMYQLNLISISQQPSGSVLVNSFSKKLVKNRIKMLNKMKTKNKVLAVYGILFPLLLLAALGISAGAQTKNEKVKQVIVITEDGVKSEDIQVSVKNENGEYVIMDSTDTKVITMNDDTINPASLSVISKDGNVYIQKNMWNYDSILRANPSFKYHFDSKKQAKLLDSLLSNHPIQTFIYQDDIGIGKGYSYNFNSDTIIILDHLNELTKGNLELLNSGKIEVNSLFKNVPPNDGTFKQYLKIDGDKIYSIEKNGKVIDSMVVRGYDIDKLSDKKANNEVEIKYWKKNGDDSLILDFATSNNKKPLVIINGKESTMYELKKIEGNKDYKITYIKADKLDSQYGKKAKDGVLFAESKNNNNSAFETADDIVLVHMEKDKFLIPDIVKEKAVNALVVVDDKISDMAALKKIEKKGTHSIRYHRNNRELTAKYGKLAKDGVLIAEKIKKK